MTRTISEHQARVYEYAKSQGDRWFTIQELSTEANLPDASAKNHASRFEEAGVFERMRISPAHVFKLSPVARRRHPELIKRLEVALPIFASRRREWLQRELSISIVPSSSAVTPRQPAPSREATPTVRGSGHLSFEVPTGRGRPPAPPKIIEAGLPAEVAQHSSKTELLLSLLRRPEGASIEELVNTFGVQPHSMRAQISVKTRERGLKAVLAGGRYRILAPAS